MEILDSPLLVSEDRYKINGLSKLVLVIGLFGFLIQGEAIYSEIVYRTSSLLICFYSFYELGAIVELYCWVGISVSLYSFLKNGKRVPRENINKILLLTPWFLYLFHWLMILIH